MSKIAIIDTNGNYWNELLQTVRSAGHGIDIYDEMESAQQSFIIESPLLIFLCLTKKHLQRLESIWTLRQQANEPEVIIISDAPDPDEAEKAIKNGAWEYSQRLPQAKEYFPLIQHLVQYKSNKRTANKVSMFASKSFEGIIGDSPQIKACLNLASQAANSDAIIHLRGESGTGKELLAWAIHKNSPRVNNNFVIVDCAALPETLVESTLFGYERGAFTGAEKSQDGLIKQADKGTLFLDEVAELPLAVQKSFLRVLQEHLFRKVGGREEISSDFRLISASNKHLPTLVQKNLFREDLLFRLRSFTIELPPLRTRKEDIQSIVQYYLPRLCERIGENVKEISQDYFKALQEYHWPGNVRELINVLDRSIVSARNEHTILPQHLPTYLRVHLVREKVLKTQNIIQSQLPADENTLAPLNEVRALAVAHSEEQYLKKLLQISRGDVIQACRISGLSRSRLYTLLQKHNLQL